MTLQKIAENETGIFISSEIQDLTIERAQESKQFSLIKKESGELYLQVAISKILKEALRFLPNKFIEADFVYYSKYLSKECWHWKFDDFILCFKNGIAKQYGEIYGDFNMSVFMRWKELYEKQKADYFYQQHLDTVEKNNATEENKQSIFKERQGQTNETLSLRNYISDNTIPDENYFKKI